MFVKCLAVYPYHLTNLMRIKFHLFTYLFIYFQFIYSIIPDRENTVWRDEVPNPRSKLVCWDWSSNFWNWSRGAARWTMNGELPPSAGLKGKRSTLSWLEMGWLSLEQVLSAAGKDKCVSHPTVLGRQRVNSRLRSLASECPTQD